MALVSKATGKELVQSEEPDVMLSGAMVAHIEQTAFVMAFFMGRGEQGATESEVEDAWETYLHEDRPKLLKGELS